VILNKIKTLWRYRRKWPTSTIHWTSMIDENVKIGEYSSIGPRATINAGVILDIAVQISANCIIFKNVKIGKHTSINQTTIIDSGEIGKYCSIAPFCHIGAGNHAKDFLSSSQSMYGNKNIIGIEPIYNSWPFPPIIGNDVWISSHVVVTQGVTIGHGAIVAAGAVVTKDVPPYAIAAGVPAKVISYRFSEKTIEKILSLAWWDKPLEIQKTYSKMFSGEINWENDLDLYLK